MSHRLELTAGGGAVLYDNGVATWHSVDDASFREEFPDEILEEDDLPDILDYLVEEDYLTDDEAESTDCVEVSLDGDDDDDDDDDDYDDIDEDDIEEH